MKYNVEKEAGSEPQQVATYTSYMYKVSEKYELRTSCQIYKLDRCFTNVSLSKNAGECIHSSHECPNTVEQPD